MPFYNIFLKINGFLKVLLPLIITIFKNAALIFKKKGQNEKQPRFFGLLLSRSNGFLLLLNKLGCSLANFLAPNLNFEKNQIVKFFLFLIKLIEHH